MSDEPQRPYDRLTGKTSDICRHLAYVGFAILWLFREGSGADICFPTQFLLPVTLLASSLAVDLLQYFLGSVLLEFGGQSEPGWLGVVSRLLFYIKVLLVLAAYVLIISFARSAVGWYDASS